MSNATATIAAGQVLTAKSIGDSNCIFRATVLDRKGRFVTIREMGIERRVMVKTDDRGEFIQPDRHSCAPRYRP